MRQCVYFLELCDRHLRVDLRRRQIAVTEHRLDETDVGAVIEHQGRHSVTEDVACTRFVDASRLDVFLCEVRQTITVKGLAVLVQEQVTRIRLHNQ